MLSLSAYTTAAPILKFIYRLVHRSKLRLSAGWDRVVSLVTETLDRDHYFWCSRCIGFLPKHLMTMTQFFDNDFTCSDCSRLFTAACTLGKMVLNLPHTRNTVNMMPVGYSSAQLNLCSIRHSHELTLAYQHQIYKKSKKMSKFTQS